jgi:hypothetical protein
VKPQSLVLSFILLISSTTLYMQSGRPIPPGVRAADRAEDTFEKSSIPPQNRKPAVDQRQLQLDADELAMLAQSIPMQVDQTTKGVLPKDLGEKLKRIEKLAKQLRTKLSH